MQDDWFSFVDVDGGSSNIFRTEPLLPLPFNGHLVPQIVSLVGNSLQHSRNLHVTGILALQESFSCISKFAGVALIRFTSSSVTDLLGDPLDSRPGSRTCLQRAKQITSSKNNRIELHSGCRSRSDVSGWMHLGKFVRSTFTHSGKETQQFPSLPDLALAAALLPPFNNLSPKLHAIQLENPDGQINRHRDQLPGTSDLQGRADLSLPQIKWTAEALEPRTGIEFPTVLHNILAGENMSTTSVVLLGTGFRSMRIMKVKTLKVYAFGVYVQPDSICEKLGPKYASMPINELNNQAELLEDLFREDINMTVRLVVNCNGLKSNMVRKCINWDVFGWMDSYSMGIHERTPTFKAKLSVFEKSLHTRLSKMNPNTDHHSLITFSSYFKQDISLPAGTTIDFRQTADGQLITEIGGKQLGTVHCKDLCRTFFDIYAKDVSTSVDAKEEITKNIARIIRR